ncbi:ABC transporter substrate-binding protein [Thermus aquaticus]|uniref:Glycerol-3-phosphate ABC transporter, periplasmic glycerol-3-phosphate-binding protein n=1 Tax=Thermus aquaticus (strain ATCC BAA-2747 / Y51MC23) TaxID=498848 RepID=A0ABM5VQY3_THEA5|nr:ABC transporter substrate-binding protein [Thermus aquaticus]ALJ92058.1 glycerol-3-phosphate ABC transporter, periplasmic glycerol-3-phosphate-binding protein [Thermus aquaticus Y51MC23]
MKKLWALLFLLLPALAQVEVPFWHSMDGPAGRLLAAFAQEFAAKDGRYRVLPQYVGGYRDGETKLVAALRSGTAPVLFQAELPFFPRLVAEGRALALDPYLNLERGFLEDLFEPAWNYGLLEGKRYGLPLNTSTPVLFYNLDAFRAKGLKAPRNWKEFEEAAKALSSRQAKGFIFVTDPQAWLFEAMVTSRGGNLVKDGKPNLTSKEALEALEMLDRLNRAGALSARSMAEATFAQLDFVRTKGMMVMASIANWPAAENFSFAFTLGVAPVPREPGGKVPMGGAQLVVLKGASEAQVRGALEFWKYLMEPRNVARWVEASYYVPVRKSAIPLLEGFYRENPFRKVAFEQIAHAQERPKEPQFTAWASLLAEALERSLKGGVPPRKALEEAQRKAEAIR